MNNVLKASLYWFFGILLSFSTVLLILLYLMAKMYGIQPEILRGFIGAWLSGIPIVGIIPTLLTIIGVADDKLMTYFSEIGRQMILYGNGIAWAVWTPILVYRWVLAPIGNFLFFMVVVLPKNKADVPD